MPILIKKPTNSQRSRFETAGLEYCMTHLLASRISENRAAEYIKKHLEDEFEGQTLIIDVNRKHKVSAASIKKTSDGDLLISVSAIQVTYRKLPEILVLIRKLVQAYEDKGVIVKFPSGNRAKGMSMKMAKTCQELDIGRFDAFDTSRACGANHVCRSSSCRHSFVATNCPSPDNPYSCPKCGSSMYSSRINYDYRADNVGKHWGTMSDDQFLRSIDVFSTEFRNMSYKDQLKILELKDLTVSDVPSHALNTKDELRVEVKEKVNDWSLVDYKELKKFVIKFAKAKQLALTSKKRKALVEFCESNQITSDQIPKPQK